MDIPEYQKGEFNKFLQDEAVINSGKMYNRLVDMCFDKCVGASGWSGGMTSKKLDSSETTCITNCTIKLMKSSQRGGFRYQEFMQQNEKAQQ